MSSKGKGSLFDYLSDKRKSNTTASSSSSKDQKDKEDSGVFSGRGSGSSRGKFVDNLTALCSEISISNRSVGRGRAKLFELLKSVNTEEEPQANRSESSNINSSKKRESLPSDSSIEKSNNSLQIYKPDNVIGTVGQPIRLASNYIRIDADPNKGVFVYDVKFNPIVDSSSLQVKLLNQHGNKIGDTKTFDGTTLFLPVLLQNEVSKLISKHPNDNSNVEISIIFKKKEALKDCVNLYNIIFNKVMKVLKYVQFDRKHFDPTASKIIPHAKLEIWPGYVTSVNEYDGGLMLCCDVSHKLLCQKSVWDILVEISRSSNVKFHENAKRALLGSVVLTGYNNRTYRIDDIAFNQSPLSKFQIGKEETTFVEYYRKNYNIGIKDENQPMIISIKKQRNPAPGSPTEIVFCLVPELCFLTGLRDDIRTDFKLMREIATITQVTPNQRYLGLQNFYTNINKSVEACQILKNWGLKLRDSVEFIDGRQFREEQIFFGKKQTTGGLKAEFAGFSTSNVMIEVVNLSNWLVIYCKKDFKIAKSFTDLMERNAPALGITVLEPKLFALNDDRVETYVDALRKNIQQKSQIVVCFFPCSREDRYSAVKKICCTEIPIPSQVINARTLSNPTKNRSIVLKIALQMNCKLGGSLWSVNIPFKNTMICGIDSYHDASQKGNSVSAFVASLDSRYTRWYSKAMIQTKKEEILNGLCILFITALEAYKQENNYLPDSVIIYRDGVGDGQFPLVMNYEIPQLKSACANKFPEYNIKLTFIVVQKRINTRYLNVKPNTIDNVYPGTVIDHKITRKDFFDFFLVSQSVKQGTSTPTHYVVLYDDSNYSPDIVQRLTYKLTFLYYNWPGTIRVPAVCQYAHKLAYLIGQSIRRNPHDKLSNKLFYL